jgi:hypothetical protein
VARLQGVPVAGAIQLNRGDHSIVWRSFTDRGGMGSVPVNYLLHRHMIEHACRRGSRFYHLGESGGVESLVHFKERFGAHAYASVEWLRAPQTLYRLRQRRARDLESIERVFAEKRG